MKSSFCNLESQKLHYLEKGKGKTIVLLPSLWITSRPFEEIGEKLSKKYHIIIPDLYKGKSIFTKRATKVSDYLSALEEFLIKLRISKYFLIGISGSGFLVTSFIEQTLNKPIKVLLFSTSFNSAAFPEKRFFFIFKGYLKMFAVNFATLEKIKVILPVLRDAFSFLGTHPKQFISEAFIPIGGLTNKPCVSTTLFISKKDEFFPYKKLLDLNKSIKDLKTVTLNERHIWFFLKKDKFVKEIAGVVG